MTVTRTVRTLLVAAAAMAGLGAVAGPAAAATPGAPTAPADAPSSCRPANHQAVVKPDQPSAGHRHYRVVLTAAPGYADCTVAGVPTDVVFHSGGGAPLGVRSTPVPGQARPVTFGPQHPVHFDVQVPNTPGAAHAGSLTFTLPAPGGGIPGEQEASGALDVDAGTQVGPVQPGQ